MSSCNNYKYIHTAKGINKELEIFEDIPRQENRRWNPDGGTDIMNQEKKTKRGGLAKDYDTSTLKCGSSAVVSGV